MGVCLTTTAYLFELGLFNRSGLEVVDFVDNCSPELTHVQVQRADLHVGNQCQLQDLLEGDLVYAA